MASYAKGGGVGLVWFGDVFYGWSLTDRGYLRYVQTTTPTN